MHAEHADEQRIGAGIGAESHQRLRDRVAELAHELAQFVGGVAHDDAAAGVDHRPLGRQHQFDGALDLAGVPFEIRVVGAHLEIGRVLVRNLDVRRGDVLRYIDDDRAGAPGGGDVKRLLQRLGELVQVLDQEIVLDAGASHADRVDLLECVAADRVARHLAGQHDQRDRIHVGGGDAGHRVGRARARGHEANPRLAGRARVAVSGVRSTLFVAHQNVLDVILFVQRVVNVQHRAAGVAENVLDTLVLQELDDDFRTR